jgi:hypothetical protein
MSFDLLNETEPSNTLYVLSAYRPPRPPPRWLPAFCAPTPATNHDSYLLSNIESLPAKSVKMKSAWFPLEMRCNHVTRNVECEGVCYFLEKGGSEVTRWKCKRIDCEGHTYCGQVKIDEKGRVCFGEKGKRIVCIKY